MKEILGNVLNYISKVDAVFITTNGFIKNDGNAVMERGISQNIQQLYPNIATTLGSYLTLFGNTVHALDKIEKTQLYSFPIKPKFIINNGTNIIEYVANRFKVNEVVAGFYAQPDIKLIEESCITVLNIINNNNYKHVIFPVIDNNLGELNYNKDIKPIFEKYFKYCENVFMCYNTTSDFKG